MAGPLSALQLGQAIFGSNIGPFRKSVHGEAVPGHVDRILQGLFQADGAKLSQERAAEVLLRDLRATTGALLEGKFHDDTLTLAELELPTPADIRLGRPVAVRHSGADAPRVTLGVALRDIARGIGLEVPTLATGREARQSRRAFFEATDVSDVLRALGSAAPEEPAPAPAPAPAVPEVVGPGEGATAIPVHPSSPSGTSGGDAGVRVFAPVPSSNHSTAPLWAALLGFFAWRNGWLP